MYNKKVKNVFVLIKLINKYFWRNHVGLFFALIMPMFMILFLGPIMGPILIVPSILCFPIISILLVFMPQTIFEFKNSSLLKRIGVTPVNPFTFFISIIIFNIVLCFFSIIILFLFCFVIFYESLSLTDLSDKTKPIKQTFLDIIVYGDWLGFVFSAFSLMITTMLVGIFIATISRSSLFVQSVGIALVLVNIFIAPICLPMEMIANVKLGDFQIIKWFGYLLPMKYSVGSAINSLTSGVENSIVNLNGVSMWNWNESYSIVSTSPFINQNTFPNIPVEVEVFNSVDKILNLFAPFLFNLLFLYLIATKFTWSTRSLKPFDWLVINKIVKLLIDNKTKKNSIKFQRETKEIDSKYIIIANNIFKSFGKKDKNYLVASNNINLDIERGKNIAILGPNGAGKSVFVEMLVGLNQPEKGQFLYNFKFDNTFQEKIGIQFQDSSYPTGIKCKDVVDFVKEIYNLKISKNEMELLINKFGITNFYNKNASSLSGGQQQRLNLFLSVIHKPVFLVLDELSTGLDIKIRNNIKEYIKQYAKENNITLLVISHDMNEVEYLCEEIAVINDGKIVDKKDIKEILNEHKNLEDYISKYL